MTHQDLIRDIDAYFAGEVSGIAQAEELLREARTALAALCEPFGYVAPEAVDRFKRERKAFTPVFRMDAKDAPPEMVPLYTLLTPGDTP